jgi:hypothetical protein
MPAIRAASEGVYSLGISFHPLHKNHADQRSNLQALGSGHSLQSAKKGWLHGESDVPRELFL